MRIEQDHPCTYTASFPVDEWGRLGGLYSLADVPVAKYEDLTREGECVAMDKESQLVEVKDLPKGFTVVVEFDNVEFHELLQMPALYGR